METKNTENARIYTSRGRFPWPRGLKSRAYLAICKSGTGVAVGWNLSAQARSKGRRTTFDGRAESTPFKHRPIYQSIRAP